MVSLIESLLHIEDSDFVEIHIKCFAAFARTKKLWNNKIDGENEITDLFLATAGHEDFINDLSNRIRIDI